MVNRVAEFKHFGRHLPQGKTVLCCEITDADGFSIARVVDELSRADFLPPSAPILDTKIIRLQRAYPIYDLAYDEEISLARKAFANHPCISTSAGRPSSSTRTWTRSSKKPRRSSP